MVVRLAQMNFVGFSNLINISNKTLALDVNPNGIITLTLVVTLPQAPQVRHSPIH
jgi:hypothetical protein